MHTYKYTQHVNLSSIAQTHQSCKYTCDLDFYSANLQLKTFYLNISKCSPRKGRRRTQQLSWTTFLLKCRRKLQGNPGEVLLFPRFSCHITHQWLLHLHLFLYLQLQHFFCSKYHTFLCCTRPQVFVSLLQLYGIWTTSLDFQKKNDNNKTKQKV